MFQDNFVTNNRDSQLSLYICSYLIMNAINYVIITAFYITGTQLTIVRTLIQIVLLFLLLRAINHMGINSLTKYLYAELLGITALLYSITLGKASISSITDFAINLCMVCIPLCISAYLVHNKNILYRYLLRSSIAIVTILLIGIIRRSNLTYDMHFSYAILFVILIHLNEFINNRKVLFLALTVFEMILLFLFGSRGAFVCILFFFVIKVISLKSDSTNSMFRKVAVILASIGGSIIIYIAFNHYSSLLYNTLVRSGVSSRTAYLLFSGQFIEHDSGRNEIWNSAFTLINQEPIIGWGIGAANKIIGTYPHQIFLDLWLSFGYLFGTIVAILLLIPFRKVFLNISATPEHLYLLQIFTSMSISLLFSSTLFTNYYFFIALGVALSVNANKYE